MGEGNYEEKQEIMSERRRIRASSFLDSNDQADQQNRNRNRRCNYHHRSNNGDENENNDETTDHHENDNDNLLQQQQQRRRCGCCVVRIKRDVQIPDPVRIIRSKRLPEFGPKILFFSGGTAIKELSTCLIEYTHNSIHLITPFDSGGSSAEIRRCFDMLSVGDIRNRLLALSNCDNYETSATKRNHAEIVNLFSHRLIGNNKDGGDDVTNDDARNELVSILDGSHRLIRAVELPMRSILQNHLRWFFERITPSPNPKEESFDLRGASVGNLIIVGGFLEHDRDIVTAIFIVSKFLNCKGFCRPLTASNLHVRVLYGDGREEIGQHLMNNLKKKKEKENNDNDDNDGSIDKNKIIKIDLVKDLVEVDNDDDNNNGGVRRRQESADCHIDMLSSDLVSQTADLICYPMGSFFASIVVNLIPKGVGKSIVERTCPKIYVPNTGYDPEMDCRTLLECINVIIDTIRADDFSTSTMTIPAVQDVLNFVLIDTVNCEYCVPIDKKEIEKLGVTVIDIPLIEEEEDDDSNIGSNSEDRQQRDDDNNNKKKHQKVNPKKVVEVLISLSS